MEKIEFSSIDHKYYLNGKQATISVSGIVEFVSAKFDSEFWLEWKAWERLLCWDYSEDNKNSKPQLKARFRELRNGLGRFSIGDPQIFSVLASTYNIPDDILKATIDIIASEWAEKNKLSLIKGNEYHDSQEAASIAAGFEKHPVTGELYPVIENSVIDPATGKKVSTVDLSNLKKGYYPELIVYSKKYGVFGQLDKLWVSNDRSFFLDDYKTNEKIDTRNRFQRMLSPVSHLEDTNLNHYTIQLGTYAYILEEWGYRCGKIGLTHVDMNKDNKITNYDIPYLKEDIENILNSWLMTV